MKISERLQHAWNAFRARDQSFRYSGASSWSRPDRVRLQFGNERSIINAIYNRIAVDISAFDIHHIKMDEKGRINKILNSGINNCLTVSANIDQTGRAFIQDAVMSLLDEGCIAIVPIDTDVDPKYGNAFSVESIRVGKIKEWYPKEVNVELFNEATAQRECVILPKSMCAIVENPFYAIMNEPNSTLRRLIQKLNYLDAIDEQSSSGKLDIIIQLPYVIKNDIKARQAEERRKSIEDQLSGSRYGIAYIDGTEHITQLNRASENNLLAQVEYLTKMLYGQIGMTEAILMGTATDGEMLNYINRTLKPIITAIIDEMNRKFLSKTARTQRQTITYYSSPFELMTAKDLASIADSFIRNEVLTANEIREIMGFEPVKDARADELRNPNMGANNDQLPSYTQERQNGIEENEDVKLTEDDIALVDELVKKINGGK